MAKKQVTCSNAEFADVGKAALLCKATNEFCAFQRYCPEVEGVINSEEASNCKFYGERTDEHEGNSTEPV